MREHAFPASIHFAPPPASSVALQRNGASAVSTHKFRVEGNPRDCAELAPLGGRRHGCSDCVGFALHDARDCGWCVSPSASTAVFERPLSLSSLLAYDIFPSRAAAAKSRARCTAPHRSRCTAPSRKSAGVSINDTPPDPTRPPTRARVSSLTHHCVPTNALSSPRIFNLENWFNLETSF